MGEKSGETSRKTKKGDFIEIDFSAYTKDGMLFDTTRIEDAKKAGIEIKDKKFEPFVLCIGEAMLLKSLDKELENKDIGKNYEVALKPEHAFGKRDPKLIKIVPLSAFTEMPHAGMLVNVNGIVAKVISVTSGRALVDLNNPLAGKEIVYKFKINEIVLDNNKKIKAIAKMFGIEIEKIEEKEGKTIVSFKKMTKVSKNDVELFKKKVLELTKIEILTKEY
ncbi:MAG: FKBP-type peptidyl-prolyl cis-trans isomerase [Candidatus Pacearchaeota archaeon]